MRFWSIQGLTSYREVWELQKNLVELRAQNLCPDTVLFVEHLSVVTRGRGLQYKEGIKERQMPAPHLSNGVECIEIERGGDLTVHNPGQLVIYPIIKLGGSPRFAQKDIHAFLRGFEAWVIEVLRSLLDQEQGAKLGTDPQATGIWLGTQKVASLGIAIRKWVTYHGMAINVCNDLSLFQSISPCGFTPDVMAHVPLSLDKEHWRNTLEESLAKHWDGQVTRFVSLNDVQDALQNLR